MGEKKLPKEELLKEAEAILDEMAHSLSMNAVRGLAFFLIKIFKQLFQRIYVNEEGIQMVRLIQGPMVPRSHSAKGCVTHSSFGSVMLTLTAKKCLLVLAKAVIDSLYFRQCSF